MPVKNSQKASADKKRGQLREQFRGEEFVVPINSERISMRVPVRSFKQESEKHLPKNKSIKLSSFSERLQERRKKVMELTEKKNKQLKRKLERKEKQIEVSNAKKAKTDQSKKMLTKWRSNSFQKNKLLEKAKIKNKKNKVL